LCLVKYDLDLGDGACNYTFQRARLILSA
jgi:hypothetical protein